LEKKLPTAKEKTQKDIYTKTLNAYEQAVKAFRKGDCVTAKELFESFLEKFTTEKELVDRANIYLSLCEKRKKKESVSLKTFDDYYDYAMLMHNDGELEETLKLLEKAKKLKPKEGKVPYLESLTYCLMEDVDSCLSSLKDAVHRDKFFSVLAQNEPGFEPLWEDKKFKVITKTG
jgi:tetratricopeptide (TPR) repeat protein